jgi:hypothetical protein
LRDGSAEVPWTINIKVFVMQAAAGPCGGKDRSRILLEVGDASAFKSA